jgi:imidazole glycerol-phosphate synthase subunit HisH
MLVIVDYKVGNLGSLLNMLKRVGTNAKVTSDEKELLQAEKIILPGIGRFDYAMRKLEESGLIPALNEMVIVKKTPTLGICVGAQLMTEFSEEGETPNQHCKGLGWFKASVKKFSFADQEAKLSIPHMGWEHLDILKKQGVLKNFDEEEARFYFAHSYYLSATDSAQVAARVHYGHDIDVVLEKENISAVQFHPEKSHKYGLQLFKNFVAV